MSSSNRYRRLTDLFVKGRAVPMPDGGHLWVQAVNAFEREECLSDAQVARARLVLALKDMGDERVKVEGRMAERGRELMISELASARASAKVSIIADDMREEPEWKERMNIVLKTDLDAVAKPLSPEENALLERINTEVLDEVMRREKEEAEFLERRFARMDEAEFIDEWVDEWIERRGSALATAEYRLTELWYATRFCDALPTEDGELDHARCNGHRDKVFETKIDARSAPTELQDLLRDALDDLNLAGRDPKDSASPENSSGSSPTPNEQAESTPSTSTETPQAAPGTSPQLSATH